ncbi:MAG: hypothetical protein JJU36_12900 [Phycisphaeraceae bacterium]|nr:hypothetical protein [Phycisphaeraceae bacterium]
MPNEVVRLICPNLQCKSILSVPASARGKAVRCRQCGTKVHIPMGNKTPAAPAEVKEPAA